MQMKIKDFRLLISAALALCLMGVACQSAKKPTAALPVLHAAAPPIQKSNPAPNAPPADPEPKTQPKSDAAAEKSAIAVAEPVPAAKPAQEPEARPREVKSDSVQDLIAAVEKEYQAGDKEYLAGRAAAAKEHFDRAFNQLLAASPEIASDPRFQAEYERVLTAANKLDVATLQQPEAQQAEGASEQKSEPAPIDEANEVSNYPVDQNLKAKAAAEIKATHSDLPLMMTDQVAGYINYFSSNRGRNTLEHGLELSGRYRNMIERVLKEEGVPQDLIYLAQAESGFHPYAVSRAGARGIWQFMGSRARAYDLHHDFWMDERQDPEKSTRAAARHLKDLYNQFGDWYLAMAAYNSGPGTVQAAVKRTGYADFWELYRRNVLPKETRNYVPIIIAETIMAKNPSQYGLNSVVPESEFQYETVKINYSVDLRLVADCVDMTLAQLQDLNPSLLRTVTPKTHFDLHLPIGTTDKYQSAIASVPTEMRVSWRYHTVAPGDTMMSLARSYHTTAYAIATANQLDIKDTVEPGAKLVVPVALSKRSNADAQTYAKRLTVYRVKRNDTVQTVADNLGISPTTIRRWNRLKGDSLSGRRVLYIHLPISPGAAATADQLSSKSKHSNRLSASAKSGATVHHTVKQGETLYSIATSYNTSVAAIKETNAHVANLRPGMVLVIPQ